ncbi:hypothetical protein, partial [Xanthovirga aplysinae]|uniref:hypothetical protein n=1 Tax=Xanthovirga aplysinae TaxID=2529853 RepID=UPI001FE80598
DTREMELNNVATEYVKLALITGQYVPSYIDAYYGPDSLKPAPLTAQQEKIFPYLDLNRRADNLLDQMKRLRTPVSSGIERQRFNFLIKQIRALKAQLALRNGERMSFEEEAKSLYDANPPVNNRTHFEKILAQLEVLLPGEGSLNTRYLNYRKDFVIPKNKIDTVFKMAVYEGRRRTLKHLKLPKEESFRVEYVTDKVWSGYNWYKGDSYSLIQVNTDFPIYIERAIDLACHEGYPGHHVYNVLLEKNLVNFYQWVEFSVYPLFSPQSLIAEGSANFGIEVAFPGKQRIKFEKEVLFPLAGLDPNKAEQYYKIQEIVHQLSYADNEAARQWMNGKMTDDEVVDWLEKYALMSRERAEQRLAFIKANRSYVINYNYGRDLIKDFVERNGGREDNPKRRWELFQKVLSSPHTASDFVF